MTQPSVRLDVLLTGRAQPYTRPGSRSAINKQPQDSTLFITKLGITGDEQGDSESLYIPAMLPGYPNAVKSTAESLFFNPVCVSDYPE